MLLVPVSADGAAVALGALSSSLFRQLIPDQSSWSSDIGVEGFLDDIKRHCGWRLIKLKEFAWRHAVRVR